MIVKRFLCLANSRKLSGRCVAGRELTPEGPGPWIRPVSSRVHQEISEYERQYPDGSDPRVLDVIDITFIEHQPREYPSENWVIDSKRYWLRVRSVTITELDVSLPRFGGRVVKALLRSKSFLSVSSSSAVGSVGQDDPRIPQL